ncbi:MAG: hypothetical protein ACRD03_11335 [Acidimicrobiales bacterium]
MFYRTARGKWWIRAERAHLPLNCYPTFRSSGSFGKRQEYIAVAELLRRGFDVYMTLVDDQQIDCVLRIEVDGHPVYIDLQIKARSKNARQPGTFAAVEVRDPRPNFMFVFYSEAADTYWLMPSLDVVRQATENKGGETGQGANKGKLTIVFTSTRADGTVSPRPRFDAWRNNWEALTAMAAQVALPGAERLRPP